MNARALAPGKKRWSLTAVVGAILIAQVLAITGGILYLRFKSESKLTQAFLSEKYRGALESVAQRCVIPLATFDLSDVQTGLKDRIAAAPDQNLAFAVFDAIGEMQAAAPSDVEYLKAAKGKDVIVIEQKIEIRRWSTAGSERLIPLGKIIGVFSLKKELSRIRRQFIQSLLGALGLAALGFLASFWLLRRALVEPIAALAQAMQGMPQGSELEASGSTAVREVADLWSSFRQMTADLKSSQGQLLQAEKMTAVGQLAAGVAHEVNNPLGIILGFAQSMAAEPGLSDSLSFCVRSIEREALRCKGLVENLLSFSRKGDVSRLEPFDVNRAVEDMLSVIDAQAKTRGVEIIRELGSVKPVVGSRNQFQQIVVNLCTNAIDAMPQGGRISVRSGLSGGGGQETVVLTIEDTGSGIPEDVRKRIFEPFFTTKEVGKGTGLGLSLVYEIVQNHGGRIEVDSEVGRGTRFIVTLPAAAETPVLEAA